MKQNNPPKRITSTIINALKGGVVPRVGLEYITVGREREISALLHDIDIIADGGAAFRFIVGKYGSGKSFLLQTIMPIKARIINAIYTICIPFSPLF